MEQSTGRQPLNGAHLVSVTLKSVVGGGYQVEALGLRCLLQEKSLIIILSLATELHFTNKITLRNYLRVLSSFV